MKVLVAFNMADAGYFKGTFPEHEDAYVCLIDSGRSYEGLRVTEVYATPWALSHEGFGEIFEVLHHSALLSRREKIAARIL